MTYLKTAGRIDANTGYIELPDRKIREDEIMSRVPGYLVHFSSWWKKVPILAKRVSSLRSHSR